MNKIKPILQQGTSDCGCACIATVPPKVNLDKFIKANKVVKMTGVVIDFSSIPVA